MRPIIRLGAGSGAAGPPGRNYLIATSLMCHSPPPHCRRPPQCGGRFGLARPPGPKEAPEPGGGGGGGRPAEAPRLFGPLCSRAHRPGVLRIFEREREESRPPARGPPLWRPSCSPLDAGRAERKSAAAATLIRCVALRLRVAAPIDLGEQIPATGSRGAIIPPAGPACGLPAKRVKRSHSEVASYVSERKWRRSPDSDRFYACKPALARPGPARSGGSHRAGRVALRAGRLTRAERPSNRPIGRSRGPHSRPSQAVACSSSINHNERARARSPARARPAARARHTIKTRARLPPSSCPPASSLPRALPTRRPLPLWRHLSRGRRELAGDSGDKRRRAPCSSTSSRFQDRPRFIVMMMMMMMVLLLMLMMATAMAMMAVVNIIAVIVMNLPLERRQRRAEARRGGSHYRQLHRRRTCGEGDEKINAPPTRDVRRAA